MLIYRELWLAVRVFQACEGQWRRNAEGRLESLPHTEVRAALWALGVPARKRRKVFGQVLLLARGALAGVAAKGDRRALDDLLAGL